MDFKARVRTHIRINEESLSFLGLMLTEALTIPNPERETAKKQKVWGWHKLPESLYLYSRDDGDLLLPRGFATKLVEGMVALPGMRLVFEDERVSVPAFYGPALQEMRPWQPYAVDQLLRAEQGIYQAVPGTGKTVTMCETIRQSCQKAIVIVDKTNIARQWVDRVEAHLGFRPGVVGDGDFDISWPITIALQQTLSRIAVEFGTGFADDPFFEQFGLVCLDECHHVSAETYRNVIERFPAKYRFGLSATPDRGDGLALIARTIIGDVLIKTGAAEPRLHGHLVKPEVRIVRTSFNPISWPAHDVLADGKCMVPKCKKNGTAHGHRNNYQSVLKYIGEDVDRLRLIADVIASELDAHHLVVASRTSVLDALAFQLSFVYDGEVKTMTGKESSKERMEIAELADQEPCVVLSTIANEALDIPRLDRLHVIWPTKNRALIRQQMGRIERAHPDKTEAIIYDYLDASRLLRKQYSERRKVYDSEKLKVTEWQPMLTTTSKSF